MVHVLFKGSTLGRIFGTSIQKDNDLIFGKKVRIQILPVGCALIAEIVFRGHFRKPSVGFLNKADMRLILFGGKKSYDSELRVAAIGVKD
jgi:hypothetical protein